MYMNTPLPHVILYVVILLKHQTRFKCISSQHKKQTQKSTK